MKPIKLLSILFIFILWQGCQQHEEVPTLDKPNYVQTSIDPTKNDHLMGMLSSTLSGSTSSNGRMMTSPIGDINLDEALKVEHLVNDVVRYTFNIESTDGLMVSNLILKETSDGEVNGYIVHYQPNIDWLIAQGGSMDFTEFTGHIVFAYLNGQDYYVIKVARGIGYAYAFPNLEHANGRQPGDCNGEGTDGVGNGGSSSGGGSGFYDQYAGDYTWSSSEVAYIAGNSNDPGGEKGDGGTGGKVNDTPTLEVIFEPPPPDLISRRPCTPDGFSESCTDDTSPDAAEEACTNEPIGVLLNLCESGFLMDEDGECFKKCVDGHVKNINKECVPCPNGDCNDCPEGQFRDICGKCTSEVISDPEFIEGRCNGIRQMLVMQSKTNKEVAGFFTADGEMIILPNGGNSSHKAWTYDRYPETGVATHSFYEENGTFYVDYYDQSGTIVTGMEIIGHYHTHPYSNDPGDDPSQPSPNDKEFTQGTFAAIGNFYIISGNGIYQYDSIRKVRTETENCKKNPDPSNCD